MDIHASRTWWSDISVVRTCTGLPTGQRRLHVQRKDIPNWQSRCTAPTELLPIRLHPASRRQCTGNFQRQDDAHLFGEFFEVAESAAECGLGNGDSAARALLPLQLHLLVLHVTHLALGLLPLAVVQLVGLQRLDQQTTTTTGSTALYPGRLGEPVPEETVTHSHPVIVAVIQRL